MSPEQAMGERQITVRSDVYSLGAVLYEMLAGEPPFTGPSVQAVVARVMTEEPRSLAAQRRSVPSHVDAAVRTALEKLPADRFASAAEFARALDGTAPGEAPRRPARHRRTRAALLAGAAAVALAVFAAGGALAARLRPAAGGTPATPIRSTLLPPPGEQFAGGDGLALSADGTQLAFTVLRATPRPRLFVRTMATGAVRELPGTADAHYPFWSPDGRSLGFFAGGELRVVGAEGGVPTIVAKAPEPRGGAWAPDGTILFATDPGGVIYRVRPGGDPPVAVTRRGSDRPHTRPVLLPDGHRFLFSAVNRSGVFLGDLRTGAQRRLRRDGDAATYVAPAQLLFEGGSSLGYGRLLVQHFDPDRGTVDGDATLVADSVFDPGGVIGYTVSAGGLLVYQQAARRAQRVWVDRDGVALDSVQPDNAWTYRLAHDGARVAQGGFGLWVRELRRAVALQVAAMHTSDLQVLVSPVWSPDDARVAFGTVSSTSWAPEIRVVQADGGGDEMRLPVPRAGGMPLDWSADGTTLLVTSRGDREDGTLSLWRVSVATRAVTQWLAVPGNIPYARFSPDGRWVAYQSDETGDPELYVRPFPGPGAPVRVSPAGGGRPAWRADGRELFYLTPAGDLMVVAVASSQPGRPLAVGTPRLLVRALTYEPYSGVTPYDPSPDGQRFLLNVENRAAVAPLTVVAPRPLALRGDAR
jgi:Tol biopolymer transport system component